MICRGESCTKASFFTNIINRYNFDIEQSAAQPQGISSTDIRFKRAMKLMAVISTTLPIMFLRSNINHQMFKGIQKKSEENDSIWETPLDKDAEKRFEVVLKKFVEENMINFLYEDGVKYISFDDWVQKFTKKPKNIFKKKAKSTSADWFFSPV